MINGSLSINSILHHVSRGENEFYFYSRATDTFTNIYIEEMDEPLEHREINSNPRSISVYIDNEMVNMGEYFSRKYSQGHFFFFEHHLIEYQKKRNTLQ